MWSEFFGSFISVQCTVARHINYLSLAPELVTALNTSKAVCNRLPYTLEPVISVLLHVELVYSVI